MAIFGKFNKLHVFRFSGPFQTSGEIFSGYRRWRKVGKFFPDPEDGEKLAGTLKKKNQVHTPSGTLARAKTKKTLFHFIYIHNNNIHNNNIYII